MDTELLTKTCTKCGETKPATTEYFSPHARGYMGLQPACKQCRRAICKEYAKKAYKENPEKHRAATAKWRLLNPEKAKQQRRLSMKKWAKANPEKRREYSTKYKENRRKYRLTPRGKEVHRINKQRRRARKVSAPIGLPFDEKLQLKRQKSCCYYCGRRLVKYHVDHVIPLSRGGSDGAENKVLACPKCNLSKHDKLPHEWAEGGRLL